MASQSSTNFEIGRVIPTLFELLALLLLSFMVILLGNTKQLIDYYGLSGSNDLLSHTTSQAIAIGLGKLDQYSFTDKAVTFLVWAIIGILCFSIVQAFARFYRDFEANQQVSSNRYVHPATFVRGAFWRQVTLNFIGTLICLALLSGALYVLLAYVLPIALTYTRTFLTGISPKHFGGFVLGFVMLYGWVFVLTVTMKLLVNRHRLFSR